jgi:hypothetical protein
MSHLQIINFQFRLELEVNQDIYYFLIILLNLLYFENFDLLKKLITLIQIKQDN